MGKGDPPTVDESATSRVRRLLSWERRDPAFLTPGRLVFLLPALLLVLAFIAWPVIGTIVVSFVVTEDGTEQIGLDNYEEVLTHPATVNTRNLPWPPPLGTLLHNAIWVAIHLPLTVFGGLVLAVLLKEMRGSSIIKSAIFLGMVTPLIVAGVILRFLLESGPGVIPAFFTAMGYDPLAISWTGNRETVLIGLIMGSVWIWMGFSVIIYSAGLTTIPEEFYEAARVDGSTPYRTFIRITWPLLRPMTLVIVTMTLLWELKLFDLVFTGAGRSGGPSFGPGSGAADVMALQMWRFAFLPPLQFGLGAVVATLLTLFTLIVVATLLRRMVRA